MSQFSQLNEASSPNFLIIFSSEPSLYRAIGEIGESSMQQKARLSAMAVCFAYILHTLIPGERAKSRTGCPLVPRPSPPLVHQYVLRESRRIARVSLHSKFDRTKIKCYRALLSNIYTPYPRFPIAGNKNLELQ